MFCPWIRALLLTPRPDAAGIIQLALPRVCCICRWMMRPTRLWVGNASPSAPLDVPCTLSLSLLSLPLSLSLSLSYVCIPHGKHDCAFLVDPNDPPPPFLQGLNGEKSPFACQPGFRRITVDLTREAFCAASPEFDR